MEQRNSSPVKPSSLPSDYLRMVGEIFCTHFDAGLKTYEKLRPNPYFNAKGEVFSNEVVLAVTLLSDKQISATTVYASSDFDPKASAPTIEDILSACVDAIGAIFATLLDTKRPDSIALLAEQPHTALENIPNNWTPIESDHRKIFIKADQSNPLLDDIATKWLKKNDPKYRDLEAEEQKEIESLFVTGPRKISSGNGSDTTH